MRHTHSKVYNELLSDSILNSTGKVIKYLVKNIQQYVVKYQ